MRRPSRTRAPRAWSLIVILYLAVMAGGCGGGREPALYTLGPTAECLERFAIVRIDPSALDPFALEAGAGAFEVETGSGVTVSFARSDGEAQRVEGRYRDALRTISAVPVDDILDRRRNAVLRWENTPTAYERERIARCLRTDAPAAVGEPDAAAVPTAAERAMTRRVSAALRRLSFDAIGRLQPRPRAALGALTIMNGDGLVSRDEIAVAKKELAILEDGLARRKAAS